MATLNKQLGRLLVFAFLTITFGCNDGRVPVKKYFGKLNRSLPPQTLVEVASVNFEGQDMTVWTMANKGNSIYVTGTPFGFARWEVGANPEVPQLTFSVGKQIDRLMPKWVAPWYASGALAVLGSFAYMSGEVGASVINMSETSRPKESRRYPPYDENSDDVTADDAYIWSAVAFHPTQPIMYAFRQQDYVLTFNVNGSQLQLAAKDVYGDGNTCCVNASAVFNNKVYVAFRSRLLFFDFGGNSLTNAHEFVGLQATYVTATDRYLYVAHEPSYANGYGGEKYPAGIYVFDNTGKNVAYLQASPKVFAVNQNDTHLYANNDDTAVKIYRIQWTR